MGQPFRAVGFIAEHPRLAPLCLAPVAAAALLLFGSVIGSSRFASWAATSVAGHGVLAGVIYYLLMIFVVFAVIYFGLVIAVSIAASPFCSMLSERVEAIESGEPPPKLPLATVLGFALLDTWHSILRAVVYLMLTLSLSMIGMICALSAVLSPVAMALVALQFVITCWFIAYDFLDYPLSRRGIDFAGKFAYVEKHRAESLGFGFTVGLLLLVPLLNVLVAPVAAVGAARMFVALGPPATKN